MPNSMTATSTTGTETERNTSRMMRKITPIETVLTLLKSRSVIWIRSRVAGASPISMLSCACRFAIASSCSHCAFTSSLAALYSDPMKSNCHRSSLVSSSSFAGTKSSGIALPFSVSSPSTHLTPSTDFSSLESSCTSRASRDAGSIRTCVEFMLKVSFSFSLDCTLASVSGSDVSSS